MTIFEVIGGINECATLFQWVRDGITNMCSRRNGEQEQKLQEDVLMQLQSDLQRLGDTIPAMYDVINRAKWRIHEPCVAELLPKLKDAVYDAEDLLGEFRSYEMKVAVESNATSVEAGPNTTQLSATIDFFCGLIQGNFNKVTNIQERLSNLSGLLEKMGLHESTPRFDKSLRPETTSFHTERKIFGREKELEDMIRLLGVPKDSSGSSKRKITSNAANDRSSMAHVPVLPIIGIEGVGKTTFAQEITARQRVKSHFDKIIWICVSDEYDDKRLIKRVIKALSGKEATSDDLGDLQTHLKDEVGKKRFLLVLDDIWPDALNLKEDKKCWLNFYAHLEYALQGSMLLVTTRFKEVANKVGTMESFELEGLKANVFWDFFKQCAFGSNVPNNHLELEKIGENIVPKLKGTPLAAKTIGRLLGMRLETIHWMDILKSELWEIDQQKKTEILPALRLSYMYLPFHLKRCFSFCSVYPKDYKFEKASLAEAAEGFVEPQGSTPPKHIGYLYFQELVHLSFFQELRGAYVIHDLMHDMAQQVSRDECFIIKSESDFEKVPQNVRHLSILASSKVNEDKLLSISKKTKLRTLLCNKSIASFDTVLDNWCDELPCMRVISCASTKRFPASICNMRHLRYIKVVSTTDSTSFPSALSCPYSLQFLYAVTCECESLPHNFNNLINLQTLESRNFRYHRGGEILINAKKLGLIRNADKLCGDLIIYTTDSVTKDQAAEAHLENKECLNKLALIWMSDDVLQAMHPPTNLKYLHLQDCPGKSLTGGSSRSNNFWTLSDLTELTILGCHSLLSLDELLTHHCLHAIKKICVGKCSSLQFLTAERFDCFSSLEDLHIQKCQSLNWEKATLLPSSLLRLSLKACGDISAWFPSCLENVKSLKSLVLISCEHVMSIPSHLWSGNLASLQELRIQDCPDLVSIGERNSIANIEKVYISDCPELKGQKRTFSKGGLKKKWKKTYFQRI